MKGIEIGETVEVCAGAYMLRLGPDEPKWPYRCSIPFPPGDELVHRPASTPPTSRYTGLIRRPLDEPLHGVYLGWRWRATGTYWPGTSYDLGYDFDYDQPSLEQDKRHKLCCIRILDGDEYWHEPFECLPDDMKSL